MVLTNACGGINREFAPCTLMLITDFINMMGTNPLIGPNDERFGPGFRNRKPGRSYILF